MTKYYYNCCVCEGVFIAEDLIYCPECIYEYVSEDMEVEE